MGEKVRVLKPYAGLPKGEILRTSGDVQDLVDQGFLEIIEQEEENPKQKEKIKKPVDSVVANLPQREKEAKRSSEEVAKDILKDEALDHLKEKLHQNEISWIEDDFYNSFDKISSLNKKLNFHKEEVDSEENYDSLYFAATCNLKIKGKPQLIQKTKSRTNLVSRYVKTVKSQDEEVEDKKEYFVTGFSESIDRRRRGMYLQKSFSQNFWIYRLIHEGVEYYLLSLDQMPPEGCLVKGMNIELDDYCDLNKNLRIGTISNLFIVKEFEPEIKTMPPEELVAYMKKINEGKDMRQEWLDFVAKHPEGSINRFSDEFELLKVAFILSGKYQLYPMHLIVWGPQGTKKSWGILETLNKIYCEEQGILEAGGASIKGLIPNFREKPCDIGFISKSKRIAPIDELGKLAQKVRDNSHHYSNNLFGEINFLLDHKVRTVSTGTDSTVVKASAKLIAVSNPMSECQYLQNHIGRIDSTTMSRAIHWVQNQKEVDFVRERGIEASRSQNQKNPPVYKKNIYMLREEKEKKNIYIYFIQRGKLYESLGYSACISIIDSANAFLSKINDENVTKLYDEVANSCTSEMKDLWKSRGFHHTMLIIDGIVKFRCLFRDYDSTFTAIKEDYDIARAILMRMVEGFTSNLMGGVNL